ncbi:MAG: VanZ family protein [Planctomycetota bacterium]
MKPEPQPEHASAPPGIASNPSAKGYRHPLWAHPRLLALVCVVLIAYGSLLPFDLTFPDGARGWRHTLSAPQWVQAEGPTSSLGLSPSASDLAINLLLYVPLGVLLRLSIPRGIRPGMKGVALALFGITAVSWSLESLQSLTPTRVSSLNDVVANVGTGGLSACLCLWAWARFGTVVFRVYCRTEPIRRHARSTFRKVQSRPALTYSFVAVNALLIGLWYLVQVSQYQHDGGEAMPFVSAFKLPYDSAVVRLGRSMLVYVGLGTIVLLAMVSRHERVRLGWVVVTVIGLAVAAEAYRAATFNARPDITALILAAAAATLMGLTLYCFSIAVRKANRRSQQKPYDGPDRRRMRYDYAPDQTSG